MPVVHFKTQRPFVTPEVSRSELLLSTILFGFLLGFGYFVTLTAVTETLRTRRLSTYILMCWGGLLSSLGFSLMTWMVLDAAISPDSVWIYVWILVFWAFQINCLVQIIVNRVCILIPEPTKRFRLKLIVALIGVTLNLTVFIIWVPARLQISDSWRKANHIWDRVEKVIFLFTDGYLNWLFIRTVKKHLVDHGLTKYDRLLKFNKSIILVSLSLDVLTIGLMSLPNDFVYIQCQSLAYLIKLEIEMSISQLIVKVAMSTGIPTDLPTIFYTEDPTESTHLPAAFAHHHSTFNSTAEVSMDSDVVTTQDEASEFHMRDSNEWEIPPSHDRASTADHEATIKQTIPPL